MVVVMIMTVLFFLREAIEMFAEVFRRCDSAGCFDDDDANNGGENEENFGGDNRRGGRTSPRTI